MNILRIALCDVRRIAKDKMAIFFTLAMPLGFVFLFGSMYKDQQNRQIWLPVFNHDGHELSKIFVEEMKAPKFIVDVRSATNEVWVTGWSRAVIIPATFSADLMKGETANITFLRGKGNSEETLAAQTLTLQTIVRMVGALANADVVNNRWTNNTRETFKKELGKEPRLTMEKPAHASLRPPPSGTSFTLPGYIIMFVMMNSVMFGGITLAMEKRHKQMTRLAASPCSTMEIIAGKMLGRMIAPFIQCALLLIIGNLAFGTPVGDHPLALIPVIVCFSICCGSIGVLFGAVFEHEQQISGVGILTVNIASALAGCWWPLEVAPDFMKALAQAVPTYWGLRGLFDVMSFGKSMQGVMFECLILLIFAAGFAAIAIPALRKKAF